MEVVLYLTIQELLVLHDQLTKRFGGSRGIRDPGLLESALSRPQSGYYDTLSLQAAALLQSLMQNHGFVDGNKRIAFAATAVFLRMNGYQLKVGPERGESFLIDEVIAKRIPVEAIAAWLEDDMQVIK